MRRPTLSKSAKSVPRHIRQSIRKILDYNWADELRDFEEHVEDGPDHIFSTLVTVDNWLYGRNKRPAQYSRKPEVQS